MTYADRYHLTPEQSRFLAKKKWDENVYCGMKMENRAVTFPQTKTILEGVNVPGVQIDDIQAILNMRDAWRFLIGSIDEDVTLEYVCKLNGFIARNEALEWGKLRTGSVAISGTDYTPPVPQEATVRAELAAILAADTSATEKALTTFCWGTRGQLFWDGNKRTSLTLANKILLQAGAGVLTIRDQNMEQFNEALLNYYDTAEAEPLKAFLYENAIQGLGTPFIKKTVRGLQWLSHGFSLLAGGFCRPFRPSVYQRRRRQRASARHRSAHKRQAAQKQARGGLQT